MTVRARMLAAITFAALASSNLLLPAMHAQAPDPAAVHSRAVQSEATPRVDLFLGYSRFGVGVNSDSGTVGNRMVGLNGGSASLAYNFNRFFALAADVGGYDDSQLQLTGTGVNQPHTVNSSGTAFTYLAGPRFTIGRQRRVSAFVQALGGGVHASAVTVSNCTGTPCTALPSQNAFAMTAGGGVDIRLSHLLSLRIVQAEYMLTTFAAVPSGASTKQNDLRLSAGLVFHFGGKRSPAPVAPPAPVEAPAPVTAAAAVPPPPAPPTVSCSAIPQSIVSGGTSHIALLAANFHNGALTHSYTATDGNIAGAGATATLTAAGSNPGTITVTCTVTDDLGASASATTTVTVEAPTPVPAAQRRDLCTISFERDRKRPVRVDNEAKACLDDIALTLQRDPAAQLVIVGSHDATEKASAGAQRATNEKRYLVGDKGIDAERILLKPGSADGRKADNMLLPAGVTF
ncbi:MAG: hypothetical protein V4555_01775 [Acidobacteriota bacterium]